MKRDKDTEKARKIWGYRNARINEWWVEPRPEGISIVARIAAAHLLVEIRKEWRKEELLP